MKKIIGIILMAVVCVVISAEVFATVKRPEYTDRRAREVVKAKTNTNLINKTISVAPNSKYDLDYRLAYKHTSAGFYSTNTSIATVNHSTGLINFKKAGKVTINVHGDGGRIYKVHFRVNGVVVNVNIKKQTAYLYNNNKLLRKAAIVTGRPGKTPTPKGSFKISWKTRNTYLDGRTVGYSYYLKVKYWIAIGGTNGVGFHDASWRSNSRFGKKYYLSDGSHGCINMKEKDVAFFYKYLKAGTPVNIY